MVAKRFVFTYTENGIEHQVVDGTQPGGVRARFAYAYARERLPGSNARIFELKEVVLGREVPHEELYPKDEG